MSEVKGFEEIVKGMDRLPTLPGIAMKILEVVKKEEPDLKEIGDILSADPPLSGEILKMINSPFFGLKQKVTSVQHAVNLLGITTVKNLALSFSLVKTNKKQKENHFDYALFWKSSLVGAVATKLLAQQILPDLSEDAFFLGLLHNIGILALSQCMPKQYDLVLKETETMFSYHEAENQILGFNHMQMGEYLAKTWGLPETFYAPIGYHHDPKKLEIQNAEIQDLTRILHLSSLFIDFFHLPNKTVCLGLIELHIKEYEFGECLRVDDIAKEIQQHTMNVFPLFDIKIEEDENYMKMIEEARRELINLSSDFMNQMLEQKRKIELLSEKAIHDGMTNLINYQRFQEVWQKEFYRAKRYHLPLSLIFGDIDHFKAINDTYGHVAGDDVLKSVAKSLLNGVRESDTVSRYGGEEFAIILPETDRDGAKKVAERLRKDVASLRLDYEGKKISVTISFGIASIAPKMEVAPNELLKRADHALYQAKHAGRNKCCLFSEIETLN